MKYYTINALVAAYRQEHPEWTDELVHSKAKELHTHLNTLDMHWKRLNRRFYSRLRLNDYDNT